MEEFLALYLQSQLSSSAPSRPPKAIPISNEAEKEENPLHEGGGNEEEESREDDDNQSRDTALLAGSADESADRDADGSCQICGAQGCATCQIDAQQESLPPFSSRVEAGLENGSTIHEQAGGRRTRERGRGLGRGRGRGRGRQDSGGMSGSGSRSKKRSANEIRDDLDSSDEDDNAQVYASRFPTSLMTAVHFPHPTVPRPLAAPIPTFVLEQTSGGGFKVVPGPMKPPPSKLYATQPPQPHPASPFLATQFPSYGSANYFPLTVASPPLSSPISPPPIPPSPSTSPPAPQVEFVEVIGFPYHSALQGHYGPAPGIRAPPPLPGAPSAPQGIPMRHNTVPGMPIPSSVAYPHPSYLPTTSNLPWFPQTIPHASTSAHPPQPPPSLPAKRGPGRPSKAEKAARLRATQPHIPPLPPFTYDPASGLNQMPPPGGSRLRDILPAPSRLPSQAPFPFPAAHPNQFMGSLYPPLPDLGSQGPLPHVHLLAHQLASQGVPLTPSQLQALQGVNAALPALDSQTSFTQGLGLGMAQPHLPQPAAED